MTSTDHPLFKRHSFRRKADSTTMIVTTSQGDVTVSATSVGDAVKQAHAKHPGATIIGTREPEAIETQTRVNASEL